MTHLNSPIYRKNGARSKDRSRHNHSSIYLLAITQHGTGQILDISSKGLSFGCLYPHSFPNEFRIDLLSAKGSHIKKVKVRKTKNSKRNYHNRENDFEMVVGVEFAELSPVQVEELNSLFDIIMI